MPSWDPATYAQYAEERARPFADLMSRVGATAPRTVVDLGCGSGALTSTLAQRWPDADVLGIDSSAPMLAQAGAYAGPRLRFAAGDVTTWQPSGPVDVLVSNAVLQWVPDHLPLLARWVGHLAPGGWLAMQVPGNFDAPSHALMREFAAQPPFAARLAGVLRGAESVAVPSSYAEVLADLGCNVDVWETTYLHVLPGPDAVLRWVRGTGLRPVLEALADDPALREAFVTAYGERLRTAYPQRTWGTLLPFRRIFAVARCTT